MRGGSVRPRYFDRPRINRIYDNLFDNSIAIVCAPEGYGKTASIMHFFDNNQRSASSCAFSFREGENDREWFRRRILSMLSMRYPEFANQICEIGTNWNDTNKLIELIKQIKFSNDFFLILDNYQIYDNPESGNVIKALAYSNIGKFHLVILSRNYPLVDAEELALKGSCLIIDREDLKFSAEEIREFAGIISNTSKEITLPDTYVNWCLLNSDGWVSAVVLLTSEYLQTGEMKRSPSLGRLVRSCIIDELSDEEKEILGSLSVIGTFTLEQGDFVSGSAGAEDLIRRIWNSYGFITYKSDNTVEISAALRDEAAALFAQRNKGKEEAYKRNAQWYSGKRDYEQAFRYYYLAGSPGECETLLDNQNMVGILSSSAFVVKSVFTGTHAQNRNLIYRIYSAPEVLNAFFTSGGEYFKTKKKVTMGLETLIKFASAPHCGWKELLDAEYYYNTGKIDMAIRSADEAYTIASFESTINVKIFANLVVIKSFIYWNAHDMVVKSMERINADYDKNSGFVTNVVFETAVANAFGNLIYHKDPIPEWVREEELPEISRVFLDSGDVQKIQAYYYIRQKNYKKLLALSTSMLADTVSGTYYFRKLNGHIVKAYALWKLSLQDPNLNIDFFDPVKEMQIAVDMAEEDSLIMAFAEYGNLIVPLLGMVTESEFSNKLISACNAYQRGLDSLMESGQTLDFNERELEIISKISEGMTNSQIADELHLARITVEKSLTAIYKRLGVKNRAAAIKKANEIGIIN